MITKKDWRIIIKYIGDGKEGKGLSMILYDFLIYYKKEYKKDSNKRG